MEDPDMAVAEEEEEFYERIDAPKFVDFTIPDRSRPDKKSWFCARIGCDQNHEEVDPDELKKSFMLRVMAARSPNVRFQRALNKQGPRANTKCPQSAPAKSIKIGISRMRNMNSIPEKISVAKLKQHPIASLRETPIQKKPKVHTLTSEKEQTSTGNNKSQAKYLKTSDNVVVSKDRNLVRALFSHTPKKAAGSSKSPISEICSETKKKINIGYERKGKTQCSCAVNSNKCKGSSISSRKSRAVGSKNKDHSILKEAEHNEMRDVQIGVRSNGSDHVEEKNTNLVKPTGREYHAIMDSKIDQSDSEVTVRPSKGEAQYIDLNVSSGVCSEITTACNDTNDDDKENNLSTFENKNMHPNAATSEAKSFQFENSNPRLDWNQEAKVQNKTFQVVKLKKTTNPKPFRLRTDERGILKEANLERRLQVESKKEPASLLKHLDGVQIQETNSQSKLIRFPETKLAKNIHTRKLNGKKEKIIQGSHSKSFKTSPKQLLRITSATKAKGESISRMLKGKEEGSIKLPERTTKRSAGYMQGRKPTTVPKEPKFHRIHVPKSCIRRYDMAVS
ncbi:hypothetical protein IEQ34_013314 [Dendrobium chrysotoxum]|uniref:TPX2 central domain-containing protein n=1 Tax=Dendrobium chrysotoxum TaxID=161865 RepID=A0AAV7GRC0_DENCH|nr:hypothetical protein IEQ34_013314 [Dendrobium chrysotoxum]